jgi:hypothetical protein
MSIHRFLPRLALALVIVAAVAWAAVHREQINLETLDSWLASLGSWAPIGYVIFLCARHCRFRARRDLRASWRCLVRACLG